jgi:sortase A
VASGLRLICRHVRPAIAMPCSARRVIKKSLACCQYLFLATALTALGYCAIVVSQEVLYQSWARQQVTKRASASFANAYRTGPLAKYPAPHHTGPLIPPLSAAGSIVGKLEIPRIRFSAMIAEGTSSRVLRKAVGHLSNTALPGQDGNVVLAGHRDTFFRHLGDLKTGDVIEIGTSRGQYVYSVRFTDIISPDETWVLEPCTGQTLTLITCYPFHYVGSAPKRFMVRALRMTGAN